MNARMKDPTGGPAASDPLATAPPLATSSSASGHTEGSPIGVYPEWRSDELARKYNNDGLPDYYTESDLEEIEE